MHGLQAHVFFFQFRANYTHLARVHTFERLTIACLQGKSRVIR
jgi:hypothetical protein